MTKELEEKDREYLDIVLGMARNEGSWQLYIETSPDHMNVKLARAAVTRILQMEATKGR